MIDSAPDESRRYLVHHARPHARIAAPMRLCIIPARGGSKRFPRKNLALFEGVPLLVRTIHTAQATGLFDRIIVSTEDPEIAQVARGAGAELHERDPALATDSARLADVCFAVLDGAGAEMFCLLLPTAPFRTPEHVKESYARLELAGKPNGAMSLSEFPHVPAWAVYEDVHGYVALQWGKRWLQSRDQLPRFYRHNGVVLWMRVGAFRANGFYGPRTAPYYMAPEESVDIDTPLDLEFAEFLSERRRRENA